MKALFNISVLNIFYLLQEFEHAIEENSPLLTNMAIRFMKICGYYDPDTNKWWDFMKHLFQIKSIVSSLRKYNNFRFIYYI